MTPNLLPDSATDVGAVLARVSGFATVSLQMRGTGCSGGAFDLFGYPSDYDAYDAVEIVAHQDWVAHHKVGMVGISYSGLSELPSAGTDPPGLAAIAPMSPTDDLFSTGYPGGIYNDGFAAGWIGDRIDDAKAAAKLVNGHLVPLATTPVSKVGQPWTYYEVDAELAASGGASSACLANQALHGQSESLSSLVGPKLVAPHSGPGRQASLFDRRSMDKWAAKITVPVFISGALQDEQTGPQWTALLSALPKSLPVYATMVNGNHIDSTDPQTLSRWLEFLDVYVADKVPTKVNSLEDLVLDSFTSFASGTSAQAPLPPVRFTGATSPSQAAGRLRRPHPPGRGPLRQRGRGRRSRQSPVDVRGGLHPVAARRTGGELVGRHRGIAQAASSAPTTSGSASLRLDPGLRPATSLPASGNAWSADPDWDWTPVPSADGLGFQTAPFTRDTTIVGPATLDLWVESSSPVVDLQATVTEVRPSAGQEEYVTSGFLRSSNQVDLATSTPLFTAPDLPGIGGQEPQPALLHAGQGPHRSDRPHLPAGYRAPGRGVGSRWRPPDVGVRHARQREPDGVGPLRRVGGLEVWWSTWCTASRPRRPCRRARRCGASRAAPTRPRATRADVDARVGGRSAQEVHPPSAASASAISWPTSSPAGTRASMAPTP